MKQPSEDLQHLNLQTNQSANSPKKDSSDYAQAGRPLNIQLRDSIGSKQNSITHESIMTPENVLNPKISVMAESEEVHGQSQRYDAHEQHDYAQILNAQNNGNVQNRQNAFHLQQETGKSGAAQQTRDFFIKEGDQDKTMFSGVGRNETELLYKSKDMMSEALGMTDDGGLGAGLLLSSRRVISNQKGTTVYPSNVTSIGGRRHVRQSQESVQTQQQLDIIIRRPSEEQELQQQVFQQNYAGEGSAPGQFFKLNAEDRMRSQAVRRRQNKMFINKLPKPKADGILIPSSQKTRATNMLSVEEQNNPEVAIWMGRQEEQKLKAWKVKNHLEEMSILQQVTSMAPSHGKEVGTDGRYVHPVSNSRKTLLVEQGAKRTFPNSINSQNSRGRRSRDITPTPPLADQEYLKPIFKSSLKASSALQQYDFDSSNVYKNQGIAKAATIPKKGDHSRITVTKSVDWDPEQLQHQATHQYSKQERDDLLSSQGDDNPKRLNSQVIENISKTLAAKLEIKPAQQQPYKAARSYVSRQRGNSSISSKKMTGHSIGTGAKTSTEMQTNFDSMIAHYQTVQNKYVNGTKVDHGKFVQAKKYKNILEQPIGKMWFPSLGGGITTTQTMMTQPNIPTHSTASVGVKGALNSRAKSQNATRPSQQQLNGKSNTVSYASGNLTAGGNGTQAKRQRALQVLRNISELVDNQERLESRLKNQGKVKVQKDCHGVTIIPMAESPTDMRQRRPINKLRSSNSIVLNQHNLTTEQQGLLEKLRQQAIHQPHLTVEKESMINDKNPKIFIAKRHSFHSQKDGQSSKGSHRSSQIVQDLEDKKQHNHRADFLQGRFLHSQQPSVDASKVYSQIAENDGREYALDPNPDFEENDDACSEDYRNTMKFVKKRLKDQVTQEERYRKEMSVVKDGNRTFQHRFYRINPRSKVNMYVTRGHSEHPPTAASRVVQPSVEGTLVKSRLITNRWLGQVSKKKRVLEGKMFDQADDAMLPYSEYTISRGVDASTRPQTNLKQLTSLQQRSIRSRSSNITPNTNAKQLVIKVEDRGDTAKSRSRGLKLTGQNTEGKSGRKAAVSTDRDNAVMSTGRDRTSIESMDDDIVEDEGEEGDYSQDDSQDSNRSGTYREAITQKAFGTLERLKIRIERQQKEELVKQQRQYTSVNEGIKETFLMRQVEEQREILRLDQERLKKESESNPDVLLSPRSMALKCVGKVDDFKKMYYLYNAPVLSKKWCNKHMEDEIDYAMTRQEGLGVPMFQQDFAYRLIKLNQVDESMWKTDFIKKVYKMVEDLDHMEEEATTLDAERRQAKKEEKAATENFRNEKREGKKNQGKDSSNPKKQNQTVKIKN